ncbi:Choline transporter-like protein 2 [Willisornis vidua]|uniref:Choline transporter-like protein n=1 Tax=Willisornis vidua TaxID=1566151 RepID=A0ABQ9D5A6_9PASS|nr:Choline transporter-like protein 2 [Willisornis vidua]
MGQNSGISRVLWSSPGGFAIIAIMSIISITAIIATMSIISIIATISTISTIAIMSITVMISIISIISTISIISIMSVMPTIATVATIAIVAIIATIAIISIISIISIIAIISIMSIISIIATIAIISITAIMSTISIIIIPTISTISIIAIIPFISIIPFITIIVTISIIIIPTISTISTTPTIPIKQSMRNQSSLVIAMVASLVFIVLLRFLAGIMVWVMIVMVILVLGYVIILCVVELVIILLLIFLRKRILIAIALIKEASRAVGHVMSSLLFPLCTFFLLCLCIAYWASTAVFLSTSNEAVYKVFNESACPFSGHTCRPETFNTSNVTRLCPDAQCLFAFYGGETAYHRYLIVLQFFNVFMFFWLANFVIALGQVTLAGAFASYYWAFKKPDDMPAFPLFSAFGRALRYHTGSLAFGSLVLAIVQVIRVTLEYLDHRLKAAENKFAKFLLSCLKCCFWCLEKFIKFLNRNAYIMIAIYGTNFCTSARNAFFLLMRNIIRVAVLDKVTDFLFFLGKLLIVGSVGILAFFFFTHRIKLVQDTAPPLNYYWVPILTVIVGSYLIAHGFFSVYGMCVDTLFLCFLEDLERNDGSADRPYFMSPDLRKLLKKTNTGQEAA